MKTEKNILAGLCAIVMLGFCALTADIKAEPNNTAMDAYKLRMQGKADEAKALLEKAVQENPGNAMAYYELARTNYYMATGEPQKLADRIADAQQAIDQAIELDPNNVMYKMFEGHIALFGTYMAQGKEGAAKLCEAFEAVLKLKPDYPLAMLYLVEIYGVLPQGQGGDASKAEMYAKKLEALDPIYGAKARWILQPKDANRVEYWRNVLKKHKDNTDVLEEMGKAYLSVDKVNEAVSCFEKAIKIDHSKSYLWLDLSIYHTWAALAAKDNAELRQKSITAGEEAVKKYLDSKPILPMVAYALGIQYKYLARSGHKEQADETLKQAKALDPYFSKATGAPNPDLFIPPDMISHNHRYLYRPVQ